MMIFAPLVGAILVVNAATGPITATDPTAPQLTMRERTATLQTLVQRATDCIAAGVAADPRYAEETAQDLGELIVESVPRCIEPVRAMIDAHDRFFGSGTGEAFFLGPYLDVLPAAVGRTAAGLAPRSAAEPDGGPDR